MEEPIPSARPFPLPSPGAIIGLVVVVAGLAGAGYLGYQRFNPPATQVERNTAAATHGDVVTSVTSTGTVNSTATSRLSFKTSTRVAQILVSVGDKVDAGQVLATLDTSDLELAVRQSRATLDANQAKLNVVLAGSNKDDIDAAQAQLDAANAKLAAMQAGSRDEDLAAAQAGLTSAQIKLDQLTAGPTQPDADSARANLDKAQASLDSAKANLTKVMGGATQADIQTAQIALNNANNDIAAKQAGFAAVLGGPPAPTQQQIIAAQAAINSAQASRDTAQVKLQQLQAGPTQTDIQTAQAQVAQAEAGVRQAQDQLNTVLAGATNADLAAARAGISQAQSTLGQKASPYLDADFAAQTQAVKQAQATLTGKLQPYTAADIQAARAQVVLAQVNLTQALNNLDAATLVAPISGIVSAVNLNVGEIPGAGGAGGGSGGNSSSASASSAVTIVDTAKVRIDVQVDESDISQISAGEAAKVTFDALPGRSFDGQVSATSPTGSLSQGVVGYLVSITLNNPRGVLPGMTATAQIIRDQRLGVLTVPNRAVIRQGRDRFVDVATTAAGTERRKVEVGLADDQNTEIASGLQEGEQVVIPQTTARAGVPGQAGGGGGFGAFTRPSAGGGR